MVKLKTGQKKIYEVGGWVGVNDLANYMTVNYISTIHKYTAHHTVTILVLKFIDL